MVNSFSVRKRIYAVYDHYGRDRMKVEFGVSIPLQCDTNYFLTVAVKPNSAA